MKTLFLGMIAALSAMVVKADFGDPEIARSIKIDPAEKMVLVENGKSNCVIVLSENASPTAGFAAGELSKFLKLAAGADVPVVKTADPDKISIFVGSGADVSKLPRDGFIIRGSGKKIVIAGKDDAVYVPCAKRKKWGDYFERATLFGVYDFLERFVNIRFVFPGKYGTAVPHFSKLEVPAMDIVERPDNIVRSISWDEGTWYEDLEPEKAVSRRRLNTYRLRMQTDYVPNCHGLSRMAYIERFAETHPEYFILRENGTRSVSITEKMGGQLCFSSGIVEEIYQDAKAFLLGKPAASRGIRHARYRNSAIWDANAAKNNFFNIMPQDGMQQCQCEKCKALAAKDKDWLSKQVWQMTVDAANRLKKENVPGYLTQMAYGKMCTIPPCDIPDNVLLMVAVTGPWQLKMPNGWKNSVELVDNWIKKRNGRKIWLWTYVNKRLGRAIKNAPCGTPRAVGNFYSEMKDRSFGSFMETETDRAILQMFNWYVFSKLMWNKDLDVDTIIMDAYRSLYGAGAEEMDKFFRIFEDIWLKKIMGNVIMSDIGPISIQPTDYELWNNVYTAEVFAKLEGHLAAALRKAAKDKNAVERIKFIGNEYLGKFKQTYQDFLVQQKALDKLCKQIKPVADNTLTLDGKVSEEAWKNADIIYLRGMKNAPTAVSTAVRLLRDSKNLYISYVCEEPEMANTYAPKLAHDEFNVWQSNSAEFFISPDGSRKNYFHFIVSQAGNYTDAKYTSDKKDKRRDAAWNSNAVVKIDNQEKSWSMEMAVPLASLGRIDPENIAADFARNRIHKGLAAGTRYYNWSPYARKYHDYINFGRLTFDPVKDNNLFQSGTFENCDIRGRVITRFDDKGKMLDKQLWFADPKTVKCVSLDKNDFLFDGQSLRIDNPESKSVFVAQYLPPVLDPEKTYRVTFSVKGKVNKPANYSWITVVITAGSERFSMLNPAIVSSCEWTTYSATFKPGKTYLKNKLCCIRLYSYKYNGTVWFDGIRIEEVKE